MQLFPEPSVTDFALSPLERRQRSEIMDAMQCLQSAVQLLAQRQEESPADLKTRRVLATSQQSLATLRSFVEQSFAPHTSSHI